MINLKGLEHVMGYRYFSLRNILLHVLTSFPLFFTLTLHCSYIEIRNMYKNEPRREKLVLSRKYLSFGYDSLFYAWVLVC